MKRKPKCFGTGEVLNPQHRAEAECETCPHDVDCDKNSVEKRQGLKRERGFAVLYGDTRPLNTYFNAYPWRKTRSKAIELLFDVLMEEKAQDIRLIEKRPVVTSLDPLAQMASVGAKFNISAEVTE